MGPAAVATARQSHVAALDGVRGVAVTLVIWFHLRPDVVPGGWIGMSVFFPLSGFLITRLLLDDVASFGTVRLRRFWARRARRLLPALYALLGAVALVLVIDGAWNVVDRGAAISSLFYVNNWWQLARSTDYWAQFAAAPSVFEHLWSLAVEEQFYLVWPLVVLAAARWTRRPLTTVAAAAGVLAASGLTYGLLITRLGWGGATDQYYNTFVRAAELLAGAELAILFAVRPATWTSTRARRSLDAAGVLLLSAVVVVAFTLDGASAGFIADGGMFVSGVATVVVVFAAVRAGRVAALLSCRPLRWAGSRCYSLYLWHWPVIVLVTSQNTALSGWPLTALQAGLIVATSVLSFWLVEERFRRATRPQIAWEPVRAREWAADVTV